MCMELELGKRKRLELGRSMGLELAIRLKLGKGIGTVLGTVTRPGLDQGLHYPLITSGLGWCSADARAQNKRDILIDFIFIKSDEHTLSLSQMQGQLQWFLTTSSRGNHYVLQACI